MEAAGSSTKFSSQTTALPVSQSQLKVHLHGRFSVRFFLVVTRLIFSVSYVCSMPCNIKHYTAVIFAVSTIWSVCHCQLLPTQSDICGPITLAYFFHGISYGRKKISPFITGLCFITRKILFTALSQISNGHNFIVLRLANGGSVADRAFIC